MPKAPTGSLGEHESSGSIAARAARFLKGGVVVWALVALLFALGSLFFPRAYESTALLEFSHGGKPADSGAEELERNVHAVVEDSKQLGKIARLDDSISAPDSEALAKVVQAIHVRARSSSVVELSYRAVSPEVAKNGCDGLAQAVVAAFPEAPPSEPKEDPRAVLDRATKDLTDFVVLHPNVTMPVDADRGAPSAASTSDPAASLLRQEKARIEAELAIPPDPSDNPYDEPAAAVDTSTLKKRLAEIQRALLERQSASAGQKPGPSTAANGAEWHRLVQAVADAQKAAFTAHDDPSPRLVARLIEPASLPSVPVESWRGPIAFLGFVLGLAMGALSVLFRALTDRRVVNPVRASSSSGNHVLALASVGAGTDAAKAATAEPLRAAITVQRPAEPAPVPAFAHAAERTPRVAAAADLQIPKPPLVPSFGPGKTQIGMMDPAAFAAAQASLPPPERLGVEARRIVGVNGSSGSPVPNHEPPRSPVPASRSSVPPPLPERARRAVSSTPPVRTPSSDPPRMTSSMPPSIPPAKVTSSMPPGPGAGSSPPRRTPLPPRPRSRMESSPPVDETPRGRGATVPNVTVSVGKAPDGRARSEYPDGANAGARQSAPPRTEPIATHRSDTSYSFVDKTARIVARRRSEQPGPSTSDRPPEAAPPAPAAPPRENPAATKPGWSSPAAQETSMVRAEHRSRPPDPEEDELIAPRSAPPSWRVGPPVADPLVKSQLNTLCDQLLSMANQQQRCFVVGVTSDPELKPGKSRTAARLATMLASTGRARVLLMEGDFDYPSAHRLLAIEMPRGSGFSQQMRVRARTGEARPWVVVRCTETLHVLGEGVLRSPGILFSQEFSDAVAELSRCYDVVVVDGPVSGAGADYRPLDAVINGVVFVVESSGHLNEGLDRASRWFRRKELVAAIPAEIPSGS